MSDYAALLSPGRIGSLALKNRIVQAPMGTNLAEEDGSCGERIQAFYEARARGGAGLLTMGVGAIAHPHGTAEPWQVGLSHDDFLPGLTRLVERVHHHGARIAIQLQHAGKTAIRDLTEGRELWVPSLPPRGSTAMMASLTQEELGHFISSSKSRQSGQPKIRVMEQADIDNLVSGFADAAERAKRAGFDGVELHAGHSYLIAGFLSPYYNRREDAYGGSLENRARLLLEIIGAVRQRVGTDYPIWMRLDAKELHTEGGIDLKESLKVAAMAEAAGLDAVSVSAYATLKEGHEFTEAPLVQTPGAFLDWASAFRKRLGIPVITAGRLSPEDSEQAIARGQCDFVAMARPLLADPELPRKLAEGRREAIRPCIYCYVCVSQIFLNQRIRCAVNPMVGHDHELRLEPTATKRHLVVVGGGPAGLEAARVAALRGHRVTLLERGPRLGGTLFFASLAYSPNGPLVDQLRHEVERLPVEVHLGVEATPALIQALAPDHLILAVGANRDAPAIAGADQAHVWSGDELRRLLTGEGEDVARRKLNLSQRMMLKAGGLSGVTGSAAALQKLSKLWMPLGKRVVILGGGLVGLELAEFLAHRGRRVSVVEAGGELGAEFSIPRRWRVLHELRQAGVELLTERTAERITAESVQVRDAEGDIQALPCDSVILASGARPDDTLARALADALPDLPITGIGDGERLGYIEGAIRAGMLAGRSL